MRDTINVPATVKPIARRPRRIAVEAAPAAPASEDITMTDTIQSMNDQVQADAKAAFSKVGEGATAALGQGKQAFEDMAQFGKGNVEAMMESSRIAMRGVEAMGQDAAAYARKSFEASTAMFRSMTGITSPVELFKLQGDFMRNSVDAAVAETSRSTERVLKLAGEIAQPIQNRVALAADKIKVAA